MKAPTLSSMRSWLELPAESDFSLANLPLGIFSHSSRKGKRAGAALGEQVIDLHVLAEQGYLDSLHLPAELFAKENLNALLERGKAPLVALRGRLIELFSAENKELTAELHNTLLVPMKEAQMHMPVRIGDYTDFYSSLEHASNVGSLFRDPSNPLLPNWKHIPVGYHGRASSIVLSGEPIYRPLGQRKPPSADKPLFGPSTQLDFELELAFITCGSTTLGSRISLEEASDYIAGFVLFNDWSARDIQAWEYVPLGPFLGKNFASSISPWMVMLEALEPFCVEGPSQEPKPLPYLQRIRPMNYDISLQATLEVPEQAPHTITRTNFKYMYWDVAQQLAHHTVGGCNIRAGDLYASGTISGPTPGSYGSMLELSWRGQQPLTLPGGAKRSFLEDGDRLSLQGFAGEGAHRVGFGEVSAKILPPQGI